MPQRTALPLGIGEQVLPLGELVHFQQGNLAFSQFSYTSTWLKHPKAFPVSPELDLLPGPFIHKPRTSADASVFHALADTWPGAWAQRVIRYAHRAAHAESVQADNARTNPMPLTALDLLCTVNDHTRLGALRVLGDPKGDTPHPGPAWWPHPIHVQPLALEELPRALAACRAVEVGRFFASDLPLLMAHGASLGGSRPKMSVLDEQGLLCIAKFPLMNEIASVPLAEVLAMKLAQRAGIDTAAARVWRDERGTPVALIRRFDRGTHRQRQPYVSAATLLQASQQETLGYLDLLRAMKRHCRDHAEDARQLWRRLLFNLLITNVDDHLRNIGFRYAARGQWSLAPAFDLNPFPQRERVSQTPLSAKVGHIRSVKMLMDHAPAFEHTPGTAREALTQVLQAVQGWRELATSAEIGMSRPEQETWAPAFEHAQVQAAQDMANVRK